MNNKRVFVIFIIFVSIFFSGCTKKIENKEQNISDINNQEQNNIGYEIKHLDVNNPDDLVLIDDDPNNDNIIKHCSDFACFINNFKECKESQIKKDLINYVVIGYSEKDDICQFLLDKLSLGEGIKECLLQKVMLTELLFRNLAGEEKTAIEQNIIKENCKEMNL